MPSQQFTFSAMRNSAMALALIGLTEGAKYEDLVCNANCYGVAGPWVALPGQSEDSTWGFVEADSRDQCVELCKDAMECEAVVYHAESKRCYGRQDVSLGGSPSHPDGVCMTEPGFETVMVGFRPGPWSKCTVLGDEVITFDNHVVVDPAVGRMVQKWSSPGEYGLVSSDKYNVQGRFGYTKEDQNEPSLIGISVAGPQGTFSIGFKGRPANAEHDYMGWEAFFGDVEVLTAPGTWRSEDGAVTARLMFEDPRDFCDQCRTTTGEAYGFAFNFGADCQVYFFPGADHGDAVITMRHIPGMTGLCGNFNCQKSDDTIADIRAMPGFPWAIETQFPMAMSPPDNWNEQNKLISEFDTLSPQMQPSSKTSFLPVALPIFAAFAALLAITVGLKRRFSGAGSDAGSRCHILNDLEAEAGEEPFIVE